MRTNTLMTAALAAVTLTACGTSAPEATNTTVQANTITPDPAASPVAAATPSATNGVQLAGDGLTVAGKTIAFGAARADALKALTAGMGGAPDMQGTQDECGPGPLAFATWSKGLQVYFQDDRFVGWGGAVDFKTKEGIGYGSPRAAVEAAFHPTIEPTSLGTEFTTRSGLSGVFESDAKDAAVSDIWAGMTCVAR